jgi:hypothetical protein
MAFGWKKEKKAVEETRPEKDPATTTAPAPAPATTSNDDDDTTGEGLAPVQTVVTVGDLEQIRTVETKDIVYPEGVVLMLLLISIFASMFLVSLVCIPLIPVHFSILFARENSCQTSFFLRKKGEIEEGGKKRRRKKERERKGRKILSVLTCLAL